MSSNYPPDFDYDVDSGAHEDCVRTEDAEKCFEKQGDSMRTNAAMKQLAGAAIKMWKEADAIERQFRDEEEARLKKIIAEASKALASGNVKRAMQVLEKEAA